MADVPDNRLARHPGARKRSAVKSHVADNEHEQRVFCALYRAIRPEVEYGGLPTEREQLIYIGHAADEALRIVLAESKAAREIGEALAASTAAARACEAVNEHVAKLYNAAKGYSDAWTVAHEDDRERFRKALKRATEASSNA